MARDLRKSGTGKADADITEFLNKVKNTPAPHTGSGKGRLLFALDATASRQPTWDHACHIQREMFDEAAKVGSLSLQIAFFRGFGEFKATPWSDNSKSLTGPMSRVSCLGGHTQIERVLNHALKQHAAKPVNAVVYVGDCMEEDVDTLCHLAGKMGLQKIPLFVFQEGRDPLAENAFRQMARLSGGAYHHFDGSSAHMLKALLNAVAVYAAGGRKALLNYSKSRNKQAAALLTQIK